jgi:hypothetical protein
MIMGQRDINAQRASWGERVTCQQKDRGEIKPDPRYGWVVDLTVACPGHGPLPARMYEGDAQKATTNVWFKGSSHYISRDLNHYFYADSVDEPPIRNVWTLLYLPWVVVSGLLGTTVAVMTDWLNHRRRRARH